MRYFLGLEVKQLEIGIFVSQERYAEDILSKFKMMSCNLVSTQWNQVKNFQSLMEEIM